ncbi:protein of unknown function [Vibrio tapetis subsp. tapetis]|uniref:Uncharacterized protein n=1 Tax=Vibrio tapetis subsp. tapetis TaxID=1671868 RepID=A0A2N8ZDG4_9VIBR|nr:protein of unknown function [Vibrio tapetis subsp. tapetis]
MAHLGEPFRMKSDGLTSFADVTIGYSFIVN